MRQVNDYWVQVVRSHHAGCGHPVLRLKIDTPISENIDYRILMPVSQITHKNEHEGKTQRSGKVDDPGCVNAAGKFRQE